VRYLLDTHAFLWWAVDDPRLSPRFREILKDPANDIYFSAASAWEIAIKHRLGHLRFSEDAGRYVSEQIAGNGFMTLSIDVRHALHVSTLPLIHRDPFDRLLIAQSQLEDLRLLTADPAITAYGIPTIW
jgi:PIN domain nuclease of toxin-antitoxin system